MVQKRGGRRGSSSTYRRRTNHRRRRRRPVRRWDRGLLVPGLVLLALILLFTGIRNGRVKRENRNRDEICYLAAKYECNGHAESVGENIEYRAYGEFQFYYAYTLVPFVNYCYEKDPKFYKSFAAYLDMSQETIPDASFREVWKALAEKDYLKFERDQQEYVIENTLDPTLAALKEAYGFNFDKCSNALKACVLSFANRDGRSLQSLGRFFSTAGKDSKEEDIIRNAYAAMQAKRPGEKRWVLEEEDCLALYRKELDIYEPCGNAAGGLNWSEKR